MTIGQKIKKLRTDKGLTQKELADHLHVTFQTVSKWENGENEPDLTTVRQLAQFFNCSLEYLINEDENYAPKEVVKEVPVVKETIVRHEYEKHVCAYCHKEIPENQLVAEDITRRERHGRMHKTVTIGQTYYHKDCLEKVKAQRAKEAAQEKARRASHSKKIAFGWSIAGGMVALISTLLILLLTPSLQESVNPGISILISVLVSYGIFAAIYCILTGSYIADLFEWSVTSTIKFPGLIFSWDLDGIAWLIGMKILFAVLGFLGGVAMFALGVALSAILGMVSFPFVLIHNAHHDYDDALF